MVNVRYKPPADASTLEPFIRFNLPMVGMSVDELVEKIPYTRRQIMDAATNYVPKCAFVAQVLKAFPQMTFYDLFYVMVETDGTYYTQRMIPLPTTFEEALNLGLKLEPDPFDDEDHPRMPLRINIYDNDVPVCGFAPDGEFYKYGAAYKKSAIAQHITHVREKAGLNV